MDRRTVIKASLGVATVCAVPISAEVDRTAELLAAIHGDCDVAVALGRTYIEREPRAAKMARAMLPSLDQNVAGDASEVQIAFDALRKAQFANNDVVIVDGWVLARCEAELCALTAELRGIA